MQNVVQIFYFVLRSSIMACVLAGLILIVRRIFKNKIGARWHYCLWIILLLRLMLPYLPQSHFSLYNLFISPEKNIVLNDQYYSISNAGKEEIPYGNQAIRGAYIAVSNISAAVTSTDNYVNALSLKHQVITAEMLSWI